MKKLFMFAAILASGLSFKSIYCQMAHPEEHESPFEPIAFEPIADETITTASSNRHKKYRLKEYKTKKRAQSIERKAVEGLD